jgi:coenzyme F420-reducing hydrogenase gamma subunit
MHLTRDGYQTRPDHQTHLEQLTCLGYQTCHGSTTCPLRKGSTIPGPVRVPFGKRTKAGSDEESVVSTAGKIPDLIVYFPLKVILNGF